MEFRKWNQTQRGGEVKKGPDGSGAPRESQDQRRWKILRLLLQDLLTPTASEKGELAMST